jgi:hypothetical protein
MHTKHNPTMASAASPSAADPKMVDLCNHMEKASSSGECAEDEYFKRPIQPKIDGDIWLVSGWVFVGFWVGRPLTQLARRKQGKKIHPDHGSRRRPMAAMVPRSQC